MTADELDALERSLSLRLPGDYRDVMLAYPFPEALAPAQAYLLDAAAYLQKMNLQIRSGDIRQRSIEWRATYFAVGTDFAGDAFVLDTALEQSAIFQSLPHSADLKVVAPDFLTWVARLKRWYLDFDYVAAETTYLELRTFVAAAGFFTLSPEPMDGWHRICLASKRSARGGLTGNSFWAAGLEGGEWYVGVWGGAVYAIPGHVGEFAVEWLRQALDGTRSDFSDAIKKMYHLRRLTDEEFAAVTQANDSDAGTIQ